jgi:hypothetical protein
MMMTMMIIIIKKKKKRTKKKKERRGEEPSSSEYKQPKPARSMRVNTAMQKNKTHTKKNPHETLEKERKRAEDMQACVAMSCIRIDIGQMHAMQVFSSTCHLLTHACSGAQQQPHANRSPTVHCAHPFHACCSRMQTLADACGTNAIIFFLFLGGSPTTKQTQARHAVPRPGLAPLLCFLSFFFALLEDAF